MATFQQIRRLHPVQMKMILDFMGQPVQTLPSTQKELRTSLQAMMASDPEKFDKYYDIVVLHKLPEGSVDETTLTDADLVKMNRVLSDHIKHLETDFIKSTRATVDQLAKAKSDDFERIAFQIIEKAKSQFVTYQVKEGKRKTRKISGIPPAQFKKLLQLAKSRKNILMVGPSGCGKTHVAGMIAEALGLPYSAQSCSVGVSESCFTGWLLPTGNNGRFNHVVSAFLKLYENGGVFLIDEMDNADPNLLVFLNMALANNKFYLPQRFDNPEVIRHPDFVAVAAANTFGGGADVLYSSRNALDAATLDRFRIGTVQMDYDENVESALIKRPEVLAWGHMFRDEIANHNLAKLLSTRAMIDAQDMMDDHDWTLKDVQEAFLADWTPEEKMMVRGTVSSFHDNLRAA